MSALLSLVPWPYRALGVAVVALVLGLGARLAYDHIRLEGYRAGYSDMKAIAEREKQAQREANQAVIDAANKALMKTADDLSMKEQELEDAREANDQAAESDAGGSGVLLPPGSVRHLSAIH